MNGKKGEQQIKEKLHRVFNEYKEKKMREQEYKKKEGLMINNDLNEMDEDDQKLDPEAPAYIPSISASPWSSTFTVPDIEFVQLLQNLKNAKKHCKHCKHCNITK